jgi:hypothetical protein
MSPCSDIRAGTEYGGTSLSRVPPANIEVLRTVLRQAAGMSPQSD